MFGLKNDDSGKELLQTFNCIWNVRVNAIKIVSYVYETIIIAKFKSYLNKDRHPHSTRWKNSRIITGLNRLEFFK